MKRILALVAAAVVAAFALAASAAASTPTSLVTDSTYAYYNHGIGDLGTAYSGSGPYYFPLANVAGGDPVQVFSAAQVPPISGVTELGGWLTQPIPDLTTGAWSASPEQIPASTYPGYGTAWDLNTETALVYKIDIPLGGATNAVVTFGVDNGVYAWFDGAYLGGGMAGGYFVPADQGGEYSYTLGSLAAGTHYLQVLREDHGGYDGYSVLMTADVAGHGWNGFFDPVSNDKLNVVNAGRAIPMKFSLGGDFGLDIFAAGYPSSHRIACPNEDPVTIVNEETVTAGGSTLQYNPSTDTYTYVWKTDKSWANTCREFDLQLKGESTMHVAQFQFK